ncbi:hypothetical protein MNBD_IGNAVI01-1155 [hydrothermal vent metagenome]|uniref:Uncharacterized protein n=1 Tax=hydrothermal vent metagenome TaxID=652676 RepID=A0A3B1C2M2_9ZZZZ
MNIEIALTISVIALFFIVFNVFKFVLKPVKVRNDREKRF